MRYRRDVPLNLLDTNPEVAQQITEHIALHLLGATHPDDATTGRPDTQITLSYEEHPDGLAAVSFIGEINAEPNAPYLQPEFDPTNDHPEVTFTPYEHPAAGQHANLTAWTRWRTHGHHERADGS